MSTLFRVLFAEKCKSTHHKLAMDALRFIECDHAIEWRNLFVGNIELYLDGSKAPDTTFRDFRNHVLHVSDNYWGGAVNKAEEWYGTLVELLRSGDFKRAVFAAGVLGHYYTDPLMPLHTGQSEREGAVHRAMEWSVTKSYAELQNILVEDLGGYPEITPSESPDWLAEMVIAGAQAAHEHYDVLIDHYDLEVGKRSPTEGLDQECKDRIARLLGHATIGFARILDRAITESAVTPPNTRVTLAGFLTRLATPLFWLTRRLADSRDKAVVKAIYQEVQERGRAVEALPEDEREVRRLHGEEVLNLTEEELIEQPVRPCGSDHGKGAAPRERSRRLIMTLPMPPEPEPPELDEPGANDGAAPAEGESDFFDDSPRFWLHVDDDVVDAPSIGPKTAARLAKVSIATVSDLLECDPDDLADKLANRHIDGDVIREWQTQSYLQCTIPGLRGHDAQILAGCGIETADDLHAMQAAELHELAGDFAETEEGQRVLRGGQGPDLDEVNDWLSWAGLADHDRAAA